MSTLSTASREVAPAAVHDNTIMCHPPSPTEGALELLTQVDPMILTTKWYVESMASTKAFGTVGVE